MYKYTGNFQDLFRYLTDSNYIFFVRGRYIEVLIRDCEDSIFIY
jgi:hypothetical protein